MSSTKWALMQWHPTQCKFIPRHLGAPLLALSSRQRIPVVDTIMQKQKDVRPVLFHKELSKSIPMAQNLLERWTNELDIDNLEQYAIALARKGNNLEIIPPITLNKLSRYGILAELEKRFMMKTSPNNTIPVTQFKKPLDLLKINMTPEALEQALQSSENFLNSDLQKLRTRWTNELRQNVIISLRGPEYDRIMSHYLPIAEQCSIVASVLAEFTAQSVVVHFPKSLSWLCRKMGEHLENALLINIANEVSGIQHHRVHKRSEYLWGLSNHQPWNVKQRMALGAFWIQAALKYCRYSHIYQSRELQRPAFWKTWYMSGPTKRGIFVVNGYLIKLLKSGTGNDPSLHVTADQIPCLSPPRPWASTHATNVGKNMRELQLITSICTEGQATVSEAIKNESALPQLQGLNRLQSQPWRINQKLLKVIKSKEQNNITIDSKQMDRDEKVRHVQFIQAISIAESLGEKVFYLPMYMDFRGRSYASSKSVLSFMGNEKMRALFLFGKSKPLGRDGLYWLQIHLANMYGKCKSQTFENRIDWVRKHKEQIVESVNDPLNTIWWTESAKPYQTLAACMELVAAWTEGDPTEYHCALPIQLDGTSNGLQHLVALARDEQNAPLVNVANPPNKACGDVYDSVLKALDANIPRCTAKKAVMTFFYGASPAKLAQIFSEVTSDSTICARMVDKLSSMFEKERQVQNWLVDCARRIMSSNRGNQSFSGASIVWTSPLGLPVVQPYVETKLMAIRTPLQSFFLPSPFHLASTVKPKQIAGIVANFVHSLDAAHMLSTAKALPAELSFSAVHDSFWTHPSTVPALNKALRQEFLHIHSRDILTELRNEWMARYDKYMVLCTVYSDSPLYNKLIWDRNGVESGRRQQEILEQELKQIYQGCGPTFDKDKYKVQWVNSVPQIGTPGLPSSKTWIPLDLSDPPQPGTLDLNCITKAKYFFS